MPLSDDWEKIFQEIQRGGATTPEELEKIEKIKKERATQLVRIRAVIASNPKNPDYYAVLDVERNMDEDDIRTHYKKLFLLLHPDKCENDLKKECNEIFLTVQNAREKLTNEDERNKYDRLNPSAGLSKTQPAPAPQPAPPMVDMGVRSGK
jgi:hypothetical protein